MNYDELEKRANSLKNSKIDSKKFAITFCGVFSSGKSTIINDLLDYDAFKLPIGVSPVTKLVTQIEYGPSLNIYYMTGGQKYNLSKEEFVDCVQDRIKIPDDCSKIYISIPSNFLKNNIVLIDTPGFLDEMGGKLEKISRDAVLEADIAVLCTNATQFGQLFEKDYLEELEESVSNFCVIVNRMDCLNTAEDVDDVKVNAFRLTKNKGGEILQRIKGGNLFFTVADGKYKNISEFEKYISDILLDESLKDALKRSSYNSIMAYKTKKLSMDIDLQIEETKEKLSAVILKHNKAKKSSDGDDQLAQLELNKEQENLMAQLDSMFASKIDNICSKINQIEKDGRYWAFKGDVEKLLNDNLLEVSIWLDYKIKTSIVLNNKMYVKGNNKFPDFTSEYISILGGFSVDEPKGKRVLKRTTFIERAFETIGDFLNGIYLLDDGYECVYSGYASIAIGQVKSGLIPKLKEQSTSLIKKFYEQHHVISSMSGYEDEIKALQDDIYQYYYLKECMLNDVKMPVTIETFDDSDVKEPSAEANIKPHILISGGFSVGRNAFVNSLLHTSLSLPVTELPIYIKLANTKDDEKAIAYYKENEYASEYKKKNLTSSELFIKSLPSQDTKNRKFIYGEQYVCIRSKLKDNQSLVLMNHLTGNHFQLWKTIEDSVKYSAIIFVLAAYKGCSDYECNCIKNTIHAYGADARNVFFVINILGSIGEKEYLEIKPFFDHILKKIYLNDFKEELYEKRVFFVDSNTSMELRKHRKYDHAEDEKTNIPCFEKYLYECIYPGE